MSKRKDPEELKRQRQRDADRKAFEKKIEEDRLGISRGKQKKVMRFWNYRIIKFIILLLIILMLFMYSPAVLPLTILLALMMIPLKRIEKAKNKNVNKKHQIKLPKSDSIIAIIMIFLTICVTGYNLVDTYIQQGEFNNGSESEIRQQLLDEGVSSRMIDIIINRLEADDGSMYTRNIIEALTLLTGERSIASGGRRMVFNSGGGSGSPPNMDFGSGEMVIRKRPSALDMLKNMPLDMIFQQIFKMVCMAMVIIMVLIGFINLIGSLKYGEIKELKLSSKFDEPKGRNAPCPCGSGKKTKYCNCGHEHR